MKRTKIFAATTMFLLAAMFVFCGAAAAVNKTLTLGNGTGNIGATVSLPITISNATDVWGIAFTLKYDPTLFTFVGLEQAVPVITKGDEFLPPPVSPAVYTQDQINQIKADLFYQVNDEIVGGNATGRVLVAAASANAVGGINKILFNAKFTIKGGDYKGYLIDIMQTLITNSAAGYTTPTLIPVLMGTTAPNSSGNYIDTNFLPYAATLIGGTINVTPASYSIGGTVTYQGGAFASGCTVVLTRETATAGVYAFSAQTTAGATGKFSFPNRTAGNYKIHVASLNPGYNDYDSSNNTPPADVIVVSGNVTNADAVLTLKTMISKTGTVTAGNIPGLMVKVTDGNGNVMGTYAVNQQNGTWQSAPLPQGTYHYNLVYGNLESALDVSTFDLTQLRAITGTITGLPLTGGIVTASYRSATWNLTKSMTVSSDGSYNIDKLAPANGYIVSVTAAGLPVTYYDGKTDITQAAPVNATSGATGINFAFTAPSSSITGTIKDIGQNVASIGVYAFEISTFAMVQAPTNASGEYTLSVNPGSYEVFVIKPNGKIFYFYNAGGLATQNEANATILTVAGSPLTGKNIDLTECDKTLSGKVTYSSETGDLAANVLVTAFTANTKAVGVTGQDGKYTVGGLCSATTYTVEVKTLTGNYPVQTTPIVAGTITTKNFVIFTGSELSGAVTEKDSSPVKNIAGAMVYLKDQLTGALAGGRLYYTGSDGKYSIRGIQGGDYTLVVSYPDYKTGTVDLAIGDNVTQDVALEKGAYFKGTVKDGSGNGLGGVTIMVTGVGNPSYAVTPSGGAYAVYGLDATTQSGYIIIAQKPGYQRQAKTAQQPNSSGGTPTPDFTLLLLATTYSVSGTVQVGSTQLQGAIVLISISNQSQNFFGSATTDANGGYTIGGLPGNGDYQFVVIPGGNLPSQSETLPVNGANITGKVVKIVAGNSISGTISGVSGATIYVFLYKGSSSPYQYVGYTKAATGGTYTFSGLTPAADYKVLAVAAGHTPTWYNGIDNRSAPVTANITLP